MPGRTKILLIGPMPLPSGGVSVHISRLLRKSKKHPHLELAVFDLRKLKLFRSNETSGGVISLLFFFLAAHVVHIHLSHPVKVFVARVCKLFGKKILYTQHNQREWKNQSSQAMINLASRILLVFDPGEIPSNGKVIPAFIPPDKVGELSGELKSKIASYKKVILSIRSDNNGRAGEEDLYGFDLILKAVKEIPIIENTALLLVDPSGSSFLKYKGELKEVIEHSGIEVICINENLDFPALLSKADLFIRASRSDGDSLSVREALQAGVTVLASDCVSRPEGCILFKSGDAVDLEGKIVSAVISKESRSFQQTDFSEEFFNEYIISGGT
jgi:glycosyltransferase involved in cell wall biosynthesis